MVFHILLFCSRVEKADGQVRMGFIETIVLESDTCRRMGCMVVPRNLHQLFLPDVEIQ